MGNYSGSHGIWSTRSIYKYLPKYVYNWTDGDYKKYRVMRKVGHKTLTFGYFDYMYEAKAFAEACFQGDCK